MIWPAARNAAPASTYCITTDARWSLQVLLQGGNSASAEADAIDALHSFDRKKTAPDEFWDIQYGTTFGTASEYRFVFGFRKTRLWLKLQLKPCRKSKIYQPNELDQWIQMPWMRGINGRHKLKTKPEHFVPGKPFERRNAQIRNIWITINRHSD